MDTYPETEMTISEDFDWRVPKIYNIEAYIMITS